MLKICLKMPNRQQFFGVYSPSSNYLNFIISSNFPDNIDAFVIVRYMVRKKWEVREITFQESFSYDSRFYYSINIGPHRFAIGSHGVIRPSVFFIRFICRHLSRDIYYL